MVGKPVEVLTTGPAEPAIAWDGTCVPAGGPETALAEILADIVHADRVPADSHFFDDLGADSLLMARFCARVRKRADLPPVSMKDIYRHPTIRSLATALTDAALSPAESGLAAVLADILHADRVPADSHFFDDLGADSLLMARFCARVRKRADLPPVSMKDIYRHPTIRSLATALTDAVPAPAESPVPATVEVGVPASAPQYVLCGALQFLFFLGYAYVAGIVAVLGYDWISAGSGLIDYYLRSVLFGAASFLVVCTLPILAKWLLIGRWKPQQIRIWSLAYVRFWIVKALVRSNPLVLFVGSPLYVLYLRALGAKVGRGVVIFSRHLPVCTDLLTIGAGTVIRKDSFILCYRAQAGMIQTGAVTLGKDVLVSETTVIDIETSMGDGAQLGHASSLHAGQAVPSGQCWHGSPAEPTEVNYRMVPPVMCGTLRRAVYPAVQLLAMVVVYVPLLIGGFDILLALPRIEALTVSLAFTSWAFYLEALAVSFVLFFGILLVALLFVSTVPRLLGLAIKPGKAYPLYGRHYSLHRAIARATNSKFLAALFGDSSYIVHYLRCLGYRLSPVVQTGSNFGMEVKHESPFLSSVGTGTQVASGLSIINADFSSTSFCVSRASIGPRNFLGNMVAYPSQGRTGDNCLLATKAMVPTYGKVRQGVGLLGSPSFEIPRTVERDSRFKQMATGDEMRRRLAAKNRHNLVSIGLFLLARWFYLFVVLLIGSWGVGQGMYGGASAIASGALAIAVAEILTLGFSIMYAVLVERASTGFRGLRPKYCSIYDIDFWRTERFFKLHAGALVNAFFNGTPFKGMIYRLLGVRLGRRLFDDGGGMAEKNLVTMGDDVILNAGSFIQCHSQEDYAFKCDRITIGSGCTIGVGAMMLYGVTMEEGAVLAPDSFLMKGEEIPAHERWGGNPAREMPGTSLAMLQVRRESNGHGGLPRPAASSLVAAGSPVAMVSGRKS